MLPLRKHLQEEDAPRQIRTNDIGARTVHQSAKGWNL